MGVLVTSSVCPPAPPVPYTVFRKPSGALGVLLDEPQDVVRLGFSEKTKSDGVAPCPLT